MAFPKVLKRTNGKFNYNLVPHCFCGLPSCFDNLTVCLGRCRKWYYYTCVNVDPDSVPDHWCCHIKRIVLAPWFSCLVVIFGQSIVFHISSVVICLFY